MSRLRRLVNILLGVLCSLLIVWLIRDLVVARPLPPPPALSARAQAWAPTPTPSTDRTQGGSYGIITSKNLFSPNRSEIAAGAVVSGPKPVLHGVVVAGEKSRAYVEDPVDKRVVGYAVGDTVWGGRVKAIRSDRIVIARPEGNVEVMLQDPAKPNPAEANPAEAALGAARRRALRDAGGTPAPAAEAAPAAQTASPPPISRGGALR